MSNDSLQSLNELPDTAKLDAEKQEATSGTTAELSAMAGEVENSSDSTHNSSNIFESKEFQEMPLIQKILAILQNPGEFMKSIMGNPSQSMQESYAKKWDKIENSGRAENTKLITIFGELEGLFKLKKGETDPKALDAKIKDSEFMNLIQFMHEAEGDYKPETIDLLWSNRANLSITNGVLTIQKNEDEETFREVDITNHKSLSESILSKETVHDKIDKFSVNLESALSNHLSNIPQKYKAQIPATIQIFTTTLKIHADNNVIPQFTRERVVDAINAVNSLNLITKPIVEGKIDEFLRTEEATRLRDEYEFIWKA